MSFGHRMRYGLLAACFVLVNMGPVAPLEGRVIDAVTGNGIADATVSAGTTSTHASAAGQFAIEAGGSTVMARAPGYRALTVEMANRGQPALIRLTPFVPKALYLSFYGIGYKPIRDAALKTIREDHGLNALVIDIKGDRGLIAFKTEGVLAHAVGADRITTIPDLPGLLKELHQAGIYAIARIVVFKDDPLAAARPDLAVKTAAGALFRDREGLAWTDPFRQEVWDYNLDLAVEAARAGFDEIQFDYLRFPDQSNVRFSEQSTMASRIGAITGFLTEARQRLIPYNVFLAVDIFGYVCWNLDDTQIGQYIEDIVPLADYISPMLYPSGFEFGIPGYGDPMQHPYEIVRLSLDRARARTGVSPLRFRPWLQAFKDYAFDRRIFDQDDVNAQITGAESFGADGWMLWNPQNIYTGLGF